MEPAAKIINTVKFGSLVLTFSCLSFLAYSAEKIILDNLRKDKPVGTSQVVNSANNHNH